jgi:ElaB/YqjD/DUF883 family membrane-anchored ribosome-binding protein
MNGHTRMNDHAQLQDVRNDLRELRRDVTDLISGLAESGREGAQDKINRARDTAQDIAERGRERAHEAHDEVSKRVADRPLTSLAIAFGAGALAAGLAGAIGRNR